MQFLKKKKTHHLTFVHAPPVNRRNAAQRKITDDYRSPKTLAHITTQHVPRGRSRPAEKSPAIPSQSWLSWPASRYHLLSLHLKPRPPYPGRCTTIASKPCLAPTMPPSPLAAVCRFSQYLFPPGFKMKVEQESGACAGGGGGGGGSGQVMKAVSIDEGGNSTAPGYKYAFPPHRRTAIMLLSAPRAPPLPRRRTTTISGIFILRLLCQVKQINEARLLLQVRPKRVMIS